MRNLNQRYRQCVPCGKIFKNLKQVFKTKSQVKRYIFQNACQTKFFSRLYCNLISVHSLTLSGQISYTVNTQCVFKVPKSSTKNMQTNDSHLNTHHIQSPLTFNSHTKGLYGILLTLKLQFQYYLICPHLY